MRGGDRLVHKCSRTNGICSVLHHSTYYCRNLSFRHPSSASLAGSEVPSSLAASPRGKPRGINHRQFTINTPRCPGSLRAAMSRPYNCGGTAADGSTTSRPLQGVCKTVSEWYRIGRVRELTYRYTPRSVIVRRHCRPQPIFRITPTMADRRINQMG